MEADSDLTSSLAGALVNLSGIVPGAGYRVSSWHMGSYIG